MIETRLLRYFLTVAEERNVTRAAQLLHITQPTLSRQMTLLEQELGVGLFVRGSRPLDLTAEGLLLWRRAKEILEMVEKTEEELQAQEKQLEGALSIAAGELASCRILMEMAAQFRRDYPRVLFHLHTAVTDQIKIRLDQGLTDLGLMMEPVDMEQYEYLRMPIKERWVAFVDAAGPLAQKRSFTAQELAAVPLILPNRQSIRNEIAHWFGPYAENLQVIAYSNLATNSLLMAQAGMGSVLAVEGSKPFLDNSKIRAIPLEPELTSSTVLAWKRRQPFPATLSRFIAVAKGFLGMVHSSEVFDDSAQGGYHGLEGHGPAMES